MNFAPGPIFLFIITLVELVDIGPERCEVIKKALGSRCLTTIELEAVLESAGARCPDDLARTLNVMRRKGLIRGEVSTERGGWIWWAEGEKEAEL